MAYITAQEVKQIRQALKKELPQYKFSVRKRDHLSVNVAFLSGAKFESFEGLNWRTDKREIMEIDGNGESIGTNTEKYGENNKKIFVVFPVTLTIHATQPKQLRLTKLCMFWSKIK